MGSQMKIKVWIEPREACISEMVCTVLCGEIFMIDRDGYVAIREEWRGEDVSEGIVSSDMEECIAAAEENCPVEIIKWQRLPP